MLDFIIYKTRRKYKDYTDNWEYYPLELLAIRINRFTKKVQYLYRESCYADTHWYDFKTHQESWINGIPFRFEI